VSETLNGANGRWNIRYHLVWIVKYRRDLLYWAGVSEYFAEVVKGIRHRYGRVIDTMATNGNHVHVFMGAAPRYLPAEVMMVLKSLTGREVVRRLPLVKRELWGVEFWGDGYYVRTVGSEVTVAVIREYIKKQGQQTQHKSAEQLNLF